MNKTININLAGFIFYMDEQAYTALKRYLDTISGFYTEMEGKTEIIQDIEARIAELFSEKKKEVITLQDVDEVIQIMGKPEDYLEEEEKEEKKYSRNYSSSSTHSSTETKTNKRFFRHPHDKMVGGVCGGIAAYFNIDPIWIRLGFAVGVIAWGLSPLVYVLFWIIIPEAKTRSEKLQMQGEPINIDNISKAIKEEYDQFNDNIKKSGFETQVKDFVSGVLNFIKAVFGFLFKFIGGVFGVFLFIIGLSFFIGLISLLIGSPIIFLENNDILVGASDFSLMSQIFAQSTLHVVMLILGVFLGTLAPAFLLIYLGLRLLSNISPVSKGTIISAIILSFTGFILFGSSMGMFAFHMNESYRYSEEIEIEALNQDTIYLELDNTFIAKSEMPTKGNHNYLLKTVNLRIRKNDSDEAFIQLIKRAHGKDRFDARTNAEAIHYPLISDSNTVYFKNYLELNLDNKYRDQKVEINLYIPEGKTVFLGESLGYLHEVSFRGRNGYYDEQFGHHYLVTERGLKCLDCID